MAAKYNAFNRLITAFPANAVKVGGFSARETVMARTAILSSVLSRFNRI